MNNDSESEMDSSDRVRMEMLVSLLFVRFSTNSYSKFV